MAGRVEEAVFSSSSGTGFRIRAAQGQATDHRAAKPGLAEHRLAKDGMARHGFAGFAERVAASLFFTVFPADCRICDSPLLRVSRLPVCGRCLAALRPLQGSCCAVCGEALHVPPWLERGQAEGEEDALRQTQCPLCQRADHLRERAFERAVAYGSYDGELRDLIHLLKFQQVRPAAEMLGRMLAEAIGKLEPTFEPTFEPTMPADAMGDRKIVVVPVPLHKRKRGQRGFNQAEMIAQRALKRISRPGRFELCTGVLIRRRETGSQIGLTRHQRRENLRGAFGVSDPTRILKRDILLVDDVLTTGTTASECARVLRRAGASRVWVATVARTLKIFGGIAPPNELSPESEDRLGMAARG